jgi:hypothetical protein
MQHVLTRLTEFGVDESSTYVNFNIIYVKQSGMNFTKTAT